MKEEGIETRSGQVIKQTKLEMATPRWIELFRCFEACGIFSRVGYVCNLVLLFVIALQVASCAYGYKCAHRAGALMGIYSFRRIQHFELRHEAGGGIPKQVVLAHPSLRKPMQSFLQLQASRVFLPVKLVLLSCTYF
jgi:hypothetical protein